MLVASFTHVVRNARGSLFRSMSTVPETMKVRGLQILVLQIVNHKNHVDAGDGALSLYFVPHPPFVFERVLL